MALPMLWSQIGHAENVSERISYTFSTFSILGPPVVTLMVTLNREQCSSSPVYAGQNSGEGQNRTADTAIFSRVLCQLSYLAGAVENSNGLAFVSLPWPRPSGAARSAHLPVKEKVAGSNPVWGASLTLSLGSSAERVPRSPEGFKGSLLDTLCYGAKSSSSFGMGSLWDTLAPHLVVRPRSGRVRSRERRPRRLPSSVGVLWVARARADPGGPPDPRLGGVAPGPDQSPSSDPQEMGSLIGGRGLDDFLSRRVLHDALPFLNNPGLPGFADGTRPDRTRLTATWSTPARASA